MITALQVVEKAREYLDTPYVHQGRVKGKSGAIDCAGLLLCVGKELGLVDKDFEFLDYDQFNDGSELERILRLFAEEVSLDQALPGDVAVMKPYHYPQHCGFYSNHGLIHATLRSVVEHRIDEKYEKIIVAAFRLRGVQPWDS